LPHPVVFYGSSPAPIFQTPSPVSRNEATQKTKSLVFR